MIRINESLRYQNVVTRKVYFHYTQMKEELDVFIKEIRKAGVKMEGPLTYALYNMPTDENMLVEFIMPVNASDVQSSELEFHSYYSVENMVSTMVFGNFDEQMEFAYSALIEFLNQSQLEICTPIFHVVDQNGKYIEVLIGYKELASNE